MKADVIYVLVLTFIGLMSSCHDNEGDEVGLEKNQVRLPGTASSLTLEVKADSYWIVGCSTEDPGKDQTYLPLDYAGDTIRGDWFRLISGEHQLKVEVDTNKSGALRYLNAVLESKNNFDYLYVIQEALPDESE